MKIIISDLLNFPAIMKKNKNSFRLRFPDDEPKLKWLPLLLDAYAVVDMGIAAGVKEQEKKQKTKLACGKGCGSCCRTHKDIPVYPLELAGIYWFVIEKTKQPEREVLKKQLLNHSGGGACPFLVDSSCSIHPMRPMACRQFNVFGKQCSNGEDPFYTRRSDVLTPLRKYTDNAYSIMMPFYGIKDEAAIARAVKSGLIHTQARVLQEYAWKELARRMDDFEFAAMR